ncbi:MAG: hypothetical protein ACI8TQ_002475 [Planctomycetota bacterium]|jgi:hypothetical protein
MINLSLPLRLTLCGTILFGAAACASAPPAGTPVSETVHNIEGQNVYQWWNNPGDIDAMVAVGVSPVTANLSMTRNSATVNGRAELAAMLSAKIQSMTENWAQDTGDLNNAASMQSLMNNEQITRQLVDTELSGARAKKYHQEGNTYYVLMVLEDTSSWLDAVKSKMDEAIIQDDTYYKTEVRKSEMRDKMDALFNAEKASVTAKQTGVVNG